MKPESVFWQETKQKLDTFSLVSIIGCIVNGPGEAKISDFGLTGGTPSNLVYLDGMPDHKISQENLVDQLESEIRAKAAAKEAEMAVMAEQIIVKG